MTKIAFFDSGIGGLSVLKEAISRMPYAEYFYYADADNAPYGIQSREQVYQLTLSAVDFLAQFEPDALVLACNTATSIAGKEFRHRYDFPIIGMEPAVKPALLHHHGKKIAVTATSLTLSEKKLEDLILRLNLVDMVDKIDLDKLVVFAERFDFSSDEVRDYLNTQLASVSSKSHDAIVLGCTHFVFYKSMIQEMLGDSVKVIDGNLGTVSYLADSLGLCFDKSPLENVPRKLNFFLSGKVMEDERSQLLRKLVE